MSNPTPATPATFGELLKLLRKRAHLTQRDLGIAVGYSEAYITRLEGNSRLPDPVMVKARFIDALALQHEPRLSQQLFDLAVQAHTSTIAQSMPALELDTNLLPPLTRFIGRQLELHHVIDLVQTHRLVTLTGSGGVGKTRLAIETGLNLLDHFESGVQIVELAPLVDGAQVAQTVAGVFRIANQSSRSYAEALSVLLAGKHLLLILDNCEHVIQTCAELVEALLRACPTLHILATSREALNIPGEMAWRVPSMSVDESAQLFTERAQDNNTSFALNAQNAGDVTAICTRLDGIPLAIELAASRVSSLSVKQLAARLDDRFNLLTGGNRTALRRHQTLRALITWSHDLLSDQERTLLRRLAVFAGGWSAEAAEEVCATSRDSDMDMLFAPNVLPLLLGLVNKSMVIANNESEHTRYTMLETIRQFAWEQLERAGEIEQMQSQHAQYCLAFLKRNAPARMRDTDDPINGSAVMMACLAWVKQVKPERDNLRAALTWSLKLAHDTDIGVQLALWHQITWDVLGPREEAVNWLELAHLQTDACTPTKTRAQVLACLGLFAFRVGDQTRALNLFDEALVIFRHLEDRVGIMQTLSRKTNVWQEDDDENEAVIRSCLILAHELHDAICAGIAEWYMGIVFTRKKELSQALEYFTASLHTLPEEETGLRHAAKYYQALALRTAGQTQGTTEHIQDALSFFQASEFLLGVVVTMQSLGEIALAKGDVAKAQAYLGKGLQIGYRDGAKQFVTLYFESLAALASLECKFTQAVTLSEVHRLLVGTPIAAHNQALINTARAQLDAQILASVEAAGHRMSYDQAVAYALSM